MSQNNFQATWVTVICWNAVAYGACFIHRHQVTDEHTPSFQTMAWSSQAVVPPGYPGRFSVKARVIFLSTMTIVFTICGPILLVNVEYHYIAYSLYRSLVILENIHFWEMYGVVNTKIGKIYCRERWDLRILNLNESTAMKYTSFSYLLDTATQCLPFAFVSWPR